MTQKPASRQPSDENGTPAVRALLRALGLAIVVTPAACGGEDASLRAPQPVPDAAAASEDPRGNAPPPAGYADLRADTNRDGEVRFDDPADDDGEDDWDAAHGAVFLANIDDDQRVCDPDLDDVDLPKCNDAADEVVNGEDDLEDLAPLVTRPAPDVPSGSTATLTFTAKDRVRVFRAEGSSYVPVSSGSTFPTADVRSGMRFFIEARDVVRDVLDWDGRVELVWTVDTGALPAAADRDVVRMRVSPLMTSHHLDPALDTYVSVTASAGNAALRTDLQEAATLAGLPAPIGIATTDQWAQDFFETAFMTMPAAGGSQHVIRVGIRSANKSNPQSSTNPLRRAGRFVFTRLRGKDWAGLQSYDPARPGTFDTLNSFGNLETIPPYDLGGQSYPLGRVVRGSTPTYHPDDVFTKMMESQAVQPPLYLDTSWLLVGHIDESLSFVKASTPRGWVVLANDATAARTLLEEASTAGHGSVPMFVGKSWNQRGAAEVTIDQVLGDTDVMGASAEAAIEVAAQLDVLKAATGITDAEIVRIPFLHETISGRSIAFQPGLVNGLYLAPGHFLAPDPHGPVIVGAGGERADIFKAATTKALAPYGITVHFAEDWDTYHRNNGEVHCGTNSVRAIPAARWWESGR